MKIRTASTITIVSVSVWMVLQLLQWSIFNFGGYSSNIITIGRGIGLISLFVLGVPLVIFFATLKSKDLAILDKNEDKLEITENPVAENIGGWLILPAIGLVLSLVITLPIIGFLAFRAADARSGIAGVLGTVCFTQLLLYIYVCFVAYSFFNKRRSTPKLMIISLVIAILLNLLYVILGMAIGNGDIMELFASSLIKSILSACIWIPYFLVSERVKRTFVLV